MRGKGQDYECPTFGNGDHPRLCGEKELSSVALSPNKGSPPPMRGKDVPKGQRLLVVGITPAYAGKSFQLSRCYVSWIGSPPPMRGKVLFAIAPVAFTRITPAYAGKSYKINRRRKRLWDHPRLCGEKCTQLI